MSAPFLIMASVRRVAVDVSKPHDPLPIEFSDALAELDTIDGATFSLTGLDEEARDIEPTSEGVNPRFGRTEETPGRLDKTIRSVDQVAPGVPSVERCQTPDELCHRF